jgi:hypothetical protein
MHDNPEPTETEQELARPERRQEEEGMRYPGHEDPDEEAERSGAGADDA